MNKIAEGVWQLEGFPRDMFNVYLAEDVLMDAATRWAKNRILRQIRRRSLRLVALTHCHPDHQGAAHAVCKQLHVPLACHEADVAAVEGRTGMIPRTRAIRWGERFWAGPPHPVGRGLQRERLIHGYFGSMLFSG